MIAVEPLASTWRQRAEEERDLGAEAQARTLEWCADQLESRAREWENEKLTLEAAADESGYSRDHLSRLIAEEVLPNAGKSGAPRIRRRDLPRKPGHTAQAAPSSAEAVSSKTQMARSVVESS